jgi:predicted nucleic acid-binding protein
MSESGRMRRIVRAAVLDSYAVLAYLFGEPGHAKVVSVLERAAESGRNTFISAPNWAEIRYQVERKAGLAQWNAVSERLLALPLEVVSVGRELAESAGAIKATKRMSLADCFAAALAKEKKADLYTGDPEFKAVEGEVRVVWL